MVYCQESTERFPEEMANPNIDIVGLLCIMQQHLIDEYIAAGQKMPFETLNSGINVTILGEDSGFKI